MQRNLKKRQRLIDDIKRCAVKLGFTVWDHCAESVTLGDLERRTYELKFWPPSKPKELIGIYARPTKHPYTKENTP